jgi:hypothetical protein
LISSDSPLYTDLDARRLIVGDDSAIPLPDVAFELRGKVVRIDVGDVELLRLHWSDTMVAKVLPSPPTSPPKK